MELTKECSLCGDTKPREAFHNHLLARDGLLSQCKECVLFCRRQTYRVRKGELSADDRKHEIRAMQARKAEARLLRETLAQQEEE
jgi:hypothetical protein